MRMTKMDMWDYYKKQQYFSRENKKKYKDQRRMDLENLVIKGHDFPRVT